MKTIRCTSCRTEFEDSDFLVSTVCCPRCGTKILPMHIKDDIELKINKHEIRILTIWASNWINYNYKEGASSLSGILKSIREQVPNLALTMNEEFQQVADGLGTEVKIVAADGKSTTVKPEPKN